MTSRDPVSAPVWSQLPGTPFGDHEWHKSEMATYYASK